MLQARNRLEDGLNAKWQRDRSGEDGRSVAGRIDHAGRGMETLGLASRWQHREEKGRIGNDMRGGRLHKRSVHRRHALAAILSLMTV